MYIESVVVSGPDRADAAVYFEKGANVVQGGSNTGKSYIVQCLKFALGANTPPKPINESQGYTTLKVKFVHDDGRSFTIERHLSESSKPTFYDEEGKVQTLGVKHNPTKMNSISNQFLDRLGLNGKLLLKGTASLNNASFSLRDFEKVFLMDETRIVAEYSPLGTGQKDERTMETSILKLLLTGKDDTGVKQAKKELASKGALRHRAAAVEDIIKQFYPGDDAAEALELQKLSSFTTQVKLRLKVAETELEGAFHSSEGLFTQKASHISELEVVEGKIAEDRALLGRFGMLGQKYESDRQRLQGIEQAAVLLDESDAVLCPTCGNHFDSESCTTDVDDIKKGVSFELERISKNLHELGEAQGSLAAAIERNTSTAETTKTSIAALEKLISTEIQSSVQLVSDLKELASCLNQDHSALDKYVTNKAKLRGELKKLGVLLLEEQNKYTPESFEESAKPLVKEIQDILQRWSFPNHAPVEFNFKARDITIGGSARGNFGKGYRAIASSAFALGLMNLLKLSGRHPGFVVLDSPLTTYKEGDPEPEEDDEEVAADVIYAFYQDIADNFKDSQVIVFENKEPDMALIPHLNYQHFTKSRKSGRYGFFPLRG
jgi:DNA repair ATPase RecN